MKITDLRAISQIEKDGQISAAAIHLKCSQANLSRLLANVESRIGLKIFHRTSRSLVLTDFGRELLPYIRKQLRTHDDIIDFIDGYKKDSSGLVTVSATSGIVMYLTRYLVPKMSELHPDISFSFTVYTPQSDLDDNGVIMSQQWDLMIALSPPKDESLVSRSVAKVKMGFFTSPDYVSRNPISAPEELVNHPCILLQSLGRKENTWLYLDKETKDIREINVTGSYVCDQIQPAIELAKQGLGVLYAPLFTVGPEVDSGALQPCFSEDICIESVRYLIYRKREYQPHRVQVVIDEIVNFMALHFASALNYSLVPDSTSALMQIAKKTIPKR